MAIAAVMNAAIFLMLMGARGLMHRMIGGRLGMMMAGMVQDGHRGLGGTVKDKRQRHQHTGQHHYPPDLSQHNA